MQDGVTKIIEALTMAAGMFWQVGWSLVLGFALSAVIRVAVRRVIRAEEPEREEADYLCDLLDERLADPARALSYLDGDLDSRVAKICADFDFPPSAAYRWRDLPDEDAPVLRRRSG